MARGDRGGSATGDTLVGGTGSPVARHQAGPDPRCQFAARTPIVHRSATGAVTMTVHVPVAFRQRGGRKALVSPAEDRAPSSPTSRPSGYSPAVKALARAFRWRRLIETGVHSTIHDVARAEGINPSYASRILRLTLLAPEIVEAILGRRTAPEMALAALMRPLPVDWAAQTREFSDS